MIMASALCVMTSCANSVSVEKIQEYEAQPFAKIEMEGVGNIIYTQADQYSIRAEGDSTLIAHTVLKFEDDCLKIDQTTTKNNKGSVNYYISAPTLTRVESDGVGSFEAKQAVNFANDFEFDSEGVGSVKISDLTCKNLKFHQEGVGASELKVKCQKAVVSSEGVGACKIEIVADSLDLTNEGVGACKVKGHVKTYSCHGGGITSKINDKNLKVGE